MGKWIWCERHDSQFDEDEGCEYCYNELQDRNKLISEFLEDLKYIYFHGNRLTWIKLKKKYEKELEGEQSVSVGSIPEISGETEVATTDSKLDSNKDPFLFIGSGGFWDKKESEKPDNKSKNNGIGNRVNRHSTLERGAIPPFKKESEPIDNGDFRTPQYMSIEEHNSILKNKNSEFLETLENIKEAHRQGFVFSAIIHWIEKLKKRLKE